MTTSGMAILLLEATDAVGDISDNALAFPLFDVSGIFMGTPEEVFLDEIHTKDKFVIPIVNALYNRLVRRVRIEGAKVPG